MSKPALIVYTDGAARGNPGPAAWAVVITRPDGSVVEEKKATLGRATNNVAEYTALLEALECASTHGAGRVEIRSDSELMVKQMKGEYKVKNADLQELYQEARQLCARFERVDFTHVRREQNSQADRLCNEALDGDTGSRPAGGTRKKAPAASAELQDAVRDDALACLRGVETAWKKHDARAPTAEQVWDQLWSILEEHGAVRSGK